MNIKRSVIVAGGVIALAGSAVITAAAGPGTTMASSPALAGDQPTAALTTSASTSHRSYPAAGRPSALLNSATSDSISSSTVSASSPSVTTAASSSKAHGQGNTFGKLISSLAHVIPGGPNHGKLIGFFAKSLNPGHTNPRHKTH